MQGNLAAQGSAPTQTAVTPPLKVLMLISTHIIGGPGKGLLQLVPALHAHARVHPILCTFVVPGMEDTPFMRACKRQGIELVCLKQRFNFDLQPLWQLRDLIVREGVDVVQTHGYKESLFGLALRALIRKPWICFLHGTTDENFKMRMYHALDARVVRLADRIVSVSPELIRRLVPERHRAKARLVENAIVPRMRAIDKTAIAYWKRTYGLTDDPIVACIGRLSPEKGHDVLFEAAARLLRNGVRFQLVIAGDGPLRTKLEERAFRLGLAGSAHFVGHQSDMDLVYSAIDVLALPSRMEGMPNVVLEAMAAALPIVATRVGAVPDMLVDGKDALLVAIDDVAAFTHALQRVLTEPVSARTLGRAAYQALFPRFSVEQRVNRIEAVYTELLKESA